MSEKCSTSYRISKVTLQLFLLIYKNFILQFRRPIGTVIEIFVPGVAIVFVIVLRRFLVFENEDKCFTTFEPDPLVFTEQSGIKNLVEARLVIDYAPQTPDTNAIMAIVRDSLFPLVRGNLKIQPFNNESEVVNDLLNLNKSKYLYKACFNSKGIGIIFGSLKGNRLSYTIRLSHEVGRSNSWSTLQTTPNFQTPGSRSTNLYLSQGFLHVQKYVGNAIIKWKAERENLSYFDVNASVQKLPHPQYSVDKFISKINIILPILFVLTFLYSAGIIVKELVLEKETGIRESMLMMGLSMWILWCSWFFKQLLFLLPSVVMVTCLIKFMLFQNSDGSLLFLFILLYIISMISFSFLVSVWFNSARVGILVGFIAWFGSFCPFLFLVFRYRSINYAYVFLSCLLSNTAFGFGIEIIARLEQQTVGITWDNVFQPITVDDSFNMPWILGMLLMDSIVYLALTWYVSEVKPGKYGVPKPFYFPFMLSYWCGIHRSHHQPSESLASIEPADPSAHERVRGKPPVGISIRNLTKVYSSWFSNKSVRKKAVDNLSLDVYKGQITVLLGHNGAGKTTTMSVLSGLLTPTEGKVFINGYSILSGMDSIRKSFGICPQHNVLFDRLTVGEHLRFFMWLKGIHNRKQVQMEVDQMIEDLLLTGKSGVRASNLSGGMKRKLSVGIALIGGSELVILDEPTAGMDPYARRATWDLLGKYKQNCCIFMSTHLMDEADLLGDRIAIMAEGKLCCSGSSLFLKSRYGVGYHMTLVKHSISVSSNIEAFIKSYVPSAKKVTDIGMEVSFILPSSEVSTFSDLFDDLESKKKKLGIDGFGISITTMEEVFLKVGEDTENALRSIMKKKRSIALETTRLRQKLPQISSRDLTPKRSKPEVRFDIQENQMSIASSSKSSNSQIKSCIKGSLSSLKAEHKSDTNSGEDDVISQNVSCMEASSSSATGIKDKIQSSEKKKVSLSNLHSALSAESYDITQRTFSHINLSQVGTLCDLEGETRKRNVVILPPISKRISIIESVRNRYPLPPIFTAEDEGPMKRENECFDLIPGKQPTNDYVLNEGFILWKQQFRALLVKRYYYYVRFYPSLIIQLLFPVLFISIGLLIILTFPDGDDPPRVLDLATAALQNNDALVFYAELEGRTLNFSEFTAGDFSVKNYVDIREGILELRESVQNISNVNDCCKYKYQFLDKFCASRNVYELEHCVNVSPLFGYSRCIPCLKCCFAYKPERSCSSFYTWGRSEDQFCPSPPLISLHSSTTGPLDTINTFVNEYILRLASRIGFVRFFQTYQAGFTVSSQGPLIGVCDCERMDGKSVRGCSIFDVVQDRDCNRNPCPMLEVSSPNRCDLKPYNETLCGPNPPCYTIEPFTRDALPFRACIEEARCSIEGWKTMPSNSFIFSSNRRSIARVYPEYKPDMAVTVWYNNEGYHIPAAAFSAFQNLHLRLVTRNKNLSLVVTNHPLPRNTEIVAQNVLEDFSGFGLSILSLFGYSFFLANFVVFLVKEKESKAKLLQFVSGVNVTSYWFSALVWDFTSACIPVGLSIIVFRVFPVDTYHERNIISVFLILLLTCWAAIPMTYTFSFLFKTSLAAFSALLILFFFASVLFITAIFLLQLFGDENKEETTEFLHKVFLLSPTYGLAAAISDIYINKQIRDFCMQQNGSVCEALNLTYVEDTLIFGRPGVGVSCVYLFIEGCAFIALTIILEMGCFLPQIKLFLCNLYEEEVSDILPQSLGEDDDVYCERRRVCTGDADSEVIVIRNLMKVFNQYQCSCSEHQPKVAVDGINLAIGKGECFGLLGVNGAGKTTTFSILTGDISMTSGTAVIANSDIRTSLRTARQGIGYCPQFDALIECMTGRECLWMYARLRGVPKGFIQQAVTTELMRLDLYKYADRRCGTYSGGVKRKLSTAIAMIGSPSIILLDEPTNGMDPNTRRYLWDVLTKVTREGKSIILTSHSMEECEALCTRLAIMVNGQFKCLGSIQHLKNKYGSGITLQAKVKPKPKLQFNINPRLRFLSMPITNQEYRKESVYRKGSVYNRKASRVSFRRQSRLMSLYYKFSRRSSSMSASTRASADTSYETNLLHSFIRTKFDGAMMLEEHVGAVTYLLPSDLVSWSLIFRLLEENKEELGIIDYSVSQTTLEQVFINFAKEQEEKLT